MGKYLIKNYYAGTTKCSYAIVTEIRDYIDTIVCDLYDEKDNKIAQDRVFFYRGNKKDIPFEYKGE